MTPTASIWLASSIGAILFFVAGLLAARRRALRERDELLGRVAQLTSELEAARTTIIPPPARAPRPPSQGAIPSTEQALDGVLRNLAATRGVRSAVLADELGLVIAGVGEDHNSLAGFGALLGGVATKAREFLPLGTFKRIELEDEHHATISASPLALHDGSIMLVTLTAGPAPSSVQVTRVLEDAASVIG
jgi:predicted regulator of Ras-like GTPase activity (Roadblock/LC7/MglB family)